MRAKSIFYCTHCKENRYGSELSNNYTMGDRLIRIMQCATCQGITHEETDLSKNKVKPEIPPSAIIDYGEGEE